MVKAEFFRATLPGGEGRRKDSIASGLSLILQLLRFAFWYSNWAEERSTVPLEGGQFFAVSISYKGIGQQPQILHEDNGGFENVGT